MHVTMMVGPRQYNPDTGMSGEVRYFEGEYIVSMQEMEGTVPQGKAEVWMNREQIEAMVLMLQGALQMPQVQGSRVALKEAAPATAAASEQAKAGVEVEA
jgi:hypothetical protein